MKDPMKAITGSKIPKGLRDHWRTPEVVVNRLDFEFEFDTDVAASDENHLFENYITQEMDAMVTPWGWNNFCNPPYSDVSPWIHRAYNQGLYRRKTVMLLPSDTAVQWFATGLLLANEIRFLVGGRISFLFPGDGRKVTGNPKGSLLFIFRGYRNLGQAAITFMETPR